METLSAVREFISNCLFDASRQYKLSFMRNQLTDDNNRLAEIGLVSIIIIINTQCTASQLVFSVSYLYIEGIPMLVTIVEFKTSGQMLSRLSSH